MNKIFLVAKREFLSRVLKKSFLLATILIPLIFPAIIAVMIMIFINEEKSAKAETVQVLDATGTIELQSNSKFTFVKVNGSLEDAKKAFEQTDNFGLLYIPAIDLKKPEGISLYTTENPSVRKQEEIEQALENVLREIKLKQFNIDEETLKNLKTDISLNNINLKDGQEKESNTGAFYVLGFILGILIYMFVLIYGMQIMQGVIDEKTSKVVEVIISSVRPFQLMMGKVIGIAAVGLLQFTIWVLLIGGLSTATLSGFGVKMPQKQAQEEILKQSSPEVQQAAAEQNQMITKISGILSEINFTYIIYNFAFYFLGGYLLYGALFAAVGSSVDSIQEAQQFTLPITLPLIVAYLGLFLFILNDHSSSISFWLSIIPFTAPVAMVGRLPFGVPLWQLVLSQVLLVLGFIFTIWVASRIYRVGILMSGAKVNYRILAKWFMMKI